MTWLAALGAGLVVFLVGREVGERTGPAPTVGDQVIDVLRSRYREPVDVRALQRAAAEGAIASLGDPYTRYLDPRALAKSRDDTKGAYSGVGIRLSARGGALLVGSVFPGGPAAAGGVRAGDRLLAVDGRSVARLDDVSGSIVGAPGSTVRLRLRTGEDPPREVTLVRARVTAPAVESSVERVGGTSVGRLALYEFTQGAGGQVRAAAKKLLAAGARGIVLDLRGDLGGLVAESVASASVFLPKGSVIATTRGAHEKPGTLRARGGTLADGIPLVVLVDQHSASSSEILAGALRDSGRATLVGTRTFGKARIQVTEELRNGGALRVTVAAYRTPKGLDISKRGLLPSVPAFDDPATGVDEALDRALGVAAGERGLPPVTAVAVSG